MKKITTALAGLVTLLATASAHAQAFPTPPTSVDEPSIFALLAVGVVAGMLTWRIRNKR